MKRTREFRWFPCSHGKKFLIWRPNTPRTTALLGGPRRSADGWGEGHTTLKLLHALRLLPGRIVVIVIGNVRPFLFLFERRLRVPSRTFPLTATLLVGRYMQFASHGNATSLRFLLQSVTAIVASSHISRPAMFCTSQLYVPECVVFTWSITRTGAVRPGTG
jgi:hypothetical protein